LTFVWISSKNLASEQIKLNTLGLRTKALIAELIQRRWIMWSNPSIAFNNYSMNQDNNKDKINTIRKYYSVDKFKYKHLGASIKLY
jgi:hypothetical protein